MWPRSVRSRVIIGSLFWAAGLMMVSHLLVVFALGRFPHVFKITHWTLLTIFALVCMIAGLMGVRSGLSPLDQLRARLSAMRDGRERRLEGNYPTEVEPLVADLNALLDDREKAVKRAQAAAGDLAHGLKTPLAVLSQEADRAAAAGQHELSVHIRQQVERMRRQVDYHLAHARAAASGATTGARCAVATSVEGLARTLQRLYAERGISIDVRVSTEHAVRCQRADLDEMLGNLLDNACKWAKSRVSVTSSVENSGVEILVDDDGPGIEPSQRELVLQRGVRADEAAPGSGFGLAIVRDLAELYDGTIALSSSPEGGVRARLQLP